MKKTFIILFCLIFCFMVGCGDTKIINGKEYDTYGLIDEKDKKNPNIKYELIVGNLVWSAILFETIIAPIYFIGFSLFEPVGYISSNQPQEKGVIN